MVTRGLFITGTDTGVGKTHITCLLAEAFQALGESVGLYKPVCSGAIRSDDGEWIWDDIERLKQALPTGIAPDLICPQCFLAPLAPPEAARQQGSQVDSELLRRGMDHWLGRVKILLVEGVGGWKSPIATGETVADVARDMNFPVLVVAANRLGMINHTLLTLDSIRNLSLRPVGIVVNSIQVQDDESAASNIEMLRKFTDLPVWGALPWCGPAGDQRPEGLESMIRQIALDLHNDIN